MGDVTPIDNAIHAHTQWFVKLRIAIDSGKSEADPAVVKTDNNCAFGKWLYGDFPAQHKGTPLYNDIKALHAKFHAEAGSILSLAVTGQKAMASKAMEPAGSLRIISNNLVKKLNELKKVI